MGCIVCKSSSIDVIDKNKQELVAEEEENIKVSIRVRCMTENEVKTKADLCVEVNENSLVLFNFNDKSDKIFTFDNCYWSVDGFEKQPDGYLAPSTSTSSYCDQTKMYSEIGARILDEALRGYHASLIVYGQTGSGKTYTLFGDDANVGIIPRLCEDLCNRVSDNANIEVSFSMVEIYNETLNDLISGSTDLKIRETNNVFFIENLTETPMVFENFRALIDRGMDRRVTAETKQNDKSSRSHVITSIKIVQKEDTLQKVSKINLVDLAGSEWNKKSESTGQRFEEAKSINKSLLQLSICLFKLSEGISHVPYRGSLLTKLLKNSLQNNGKTFMISTVSPNHSNYFETLNTLRYAERAKTIRLKARINYENTKDSRIKKLERENKYLKLQLQKVYAQIPREILSKYLEKIN